MNFAPIDWIIVIVYLGASLGIGLAGRKYVGSTAHFLVAGRELGTWIGVATLAATEIGTITFMYNSELGYRYGFAALSAALISGVVMIVVGRTGFVIRRLRELRLIVSFRRGCEAYEGRSGADVIDKQGVHGISDAIAQMVADGAHTV